MVSQVSSVTRFAIQRLRRKNSPARSAESLNTNQAPQRAAFTQPSDSSMSGKVYIGRSLAKAEARPAKVGRCRAG